jgi:hypothetical protein
MSCSMFTISLSLALLVLLAGFFMLAYSKKEGLGILSKISSYIAILFGGIVFVGGMICATCGSCHKSKCGNKEMCRKEVRIEYSTSKCEKKEMRCHKEMNTSDCKKECSEGMKCDKGEGKCSDGSGCSSGCKKENEK